MSFDAREFSYIGGVGVGAETWTPLDPPLMSPPTIDPRPIAHYSSTEPLDYVS